MQIFITLARVLSRETDGPREREGGVIEEEEEKERKQEWRKRGTGARVR